MAGYSDKRAVDGLVVSRKNSGLVLKDTVNNREKNAQFCNRIGCSGRLNSMKGTQIGCSYKAKSSRPSFHPLSSGKEIIGSSSRTHSAVSNARKSSANPKKKLPTQLETDSSETSSVHDEPDVSELISPPGKIQRGLQPESENHDSREVILMEEGSSSVAANTRSRRNFHQRLGLGSQDVLVGSSMSLASRKTSQATSANTNRHGLRNLRWNSISDAIPSSSSSSLSDSSFSRRKDMVKKRNSDGESSSSSRGKKTGEMSSELQNLNSNSGISIYDSRRARNWPPIRDNGVMSVRTRRSTNSNNRVRFSNQGHGNTLAPNESPVVIPRVPESDVTVDPIVPMSSSLFSEEIPSVHPSFNSQPGSSNGGLQGLVPGSPSDVGIARSLINHDNFGRYNIDGIAELLLALERIEQDEELSYEQLLVLETNLLLNGLNFYDQHRDMRLDIDSMSYEELLALEERMGSVSTGLTEEAISKCLKTSIYQSTLPKEANLSCTGSNDNVKCSICQEEYAVGDEMGRLHCQHRYHVVCIEQWLRLKNWCPICKASAEPSMPSPP